MTTHAFVLSQGRRRNDSSFIRSHIDERFSTPVQHGVHLMRSQTEAKCARWLEDRGFKPAPCGLTEAPCYFYEPRGMKRWPTYIKGEHYRIDFVIVHAVETREVDGELRSIARRWDWLSVKPKRDAQDLKLLSELRAFDALHQPAFQWTPADIYEAEWQPSLL